MTSRKKDGMKEIKIGKEVITTMTYSGGESRYSSGEGVDFIVICYDDADDNEHELYAELPGDDSCKSFDNLKSEIVREAMLHGCSFAMVNMLRGITLEDMH